MIIPLLSLALSFTWPASTKPVDSVILALNALAAEVATGIEKPKQNPLRPRQAAYEYMADLKLASVWPREEFINGLMLALDSNDTIVAATAAKGLLNYNRPLLRSNTKRLLGGMRTYGYGRGCIVTYLDSVVTRYIKAREAGSHFQCDEGLLLPLEKDKWQPRLDIAGKNTGNLGVMTVDRAIKALTDDELCIRLQAFAWLDRQGLVISTAPLEEAWAMLNDKQRTSLFHTLSHLKTRLGKPVLRAGLERVLRTGDTNPMSDEVRGVLLMRLGRLKSELARKSALEIIAKFRGIQLASGEKTPRLLREAFRAFAPTIREGDLALGLDWAADKRDVYRWAGVYVLAHFDNPASINMVCDWIIGLDLDRLPAFYKLDPLTALSKRNWPDTKVKWQYIRTLAKVLSRPIEKEGAPSWPVGFTVDNMIRTLESMTGTSNGNHGWRSPSGFDAGIVGHTLDNWIKWAGENDPIKR